MLFLADCSYNCDDENCYKDLARLRGMKYMTWENIDKLVQEDEVGGQILSRFCDVNIFHLWIKEF